MMQVLQYSGAFLSTLAALIVSLNLGRKWTGGGFVLFVLGSVCLMVWGFMKPGSEGIGMQNIALFVINCVGVYRYLIARRSDRA